MPLVRGLATGFGTTVESMGGTLEVMDVLAEGAPDSTMGKLSKTLRSAGQAITGGYELQEPSFVGVGGIGEGLTYAQEMLGSAVGSMLSGIAAAVGGGALGTAVAGPAGTVPASILAAGGQGVFTGIGDMNNSLTADEGVKAALANGTITRKQAAYIALVGGGAIGSLDSLGVLRTLGTGVKEAAQQGLTKAIKEGIKRGAFEEGGTEALQEIISQSLQAAVGGNVDLVKRAISVVDATFGGILGGGTIGGATGAVKAQPPKAAIEDEETVGEAGETPPEEGVVEPAVPPSTPPGGVGAAPPPPVGAPVEVTTPAPPSPAPAPAPAAKPSGVTVVTPGTPPPDIAAATAPTATPPSPAAGAGAAPVPPTAAAQPAGVIPEGEVEVVAKPGKTLTPEEAAEVERKRLKRKEAIDALARGRGVDPSILAATAAQAPQVTAPAPQMPEPPGTREAAARRAQPQETPAPAAGALPLAPAPPAAPPIPAEQRKAKRAARRGALETIEAQGGRPSDYVEPVPAPPYCC